MPHFFSDPFCEICIGSTTNEKKKTGEIFTLESRLFVFCLFGSWALNNIAIEKNLKVNPLGIWYIIALTFQWREPFFFRQRSAFSYLRFGSSFVCVGYIIQWCYYSFVCDGFLCVRTLSIFSHSEWSKQFEFNI